MGSGDSSERSETDRPLARRLVAPFGFRRGDGGELVPHGAEQEAIREIVALRAQGKALRTISEAMQAKGHRISHEGVAGDKGSGGRGPKTLPAYLLGAQLPAAEYRRPSVLAQAATSRRMAQGVWAIKRAG